MHLRKRSARMQDRLHGLGGHDNPERSGNHQDGIPLAILAQRIEAGQARVDAEENRLPMPVSEVLGIK